jgi:hypothetical protein
MLACNPRARLVVTGRGFRFRVDPVVSEDGSAMPAQHELQWSALASSRRLVSEESEHR